MIAAGAGQKMLLVVAALAEEVNVVLESASRVRRLGGAPGILEVGLNGHQFLLLKSGVGPKAAAKRLADALRHVRPSLLLIIGYAGALKHGLELGNLVAIDRSSLLPKLQPEALLAGDSVCLGSWELPASPHVAQVGAAAGLLIRRSEGLTSHDVIGDPLHREVLHRQFGAGVVDMETAVLARVAELEGIPAACVRAVTDPADDTLLMPFSFGSRAARIKTHVNSFAAGRFFSNRQEWNDRTRIARRSLRRFLEVYFQTAPEHARD